MKISARNSLAGTILKIERGAVNAEITLALAEKLTRSEDLKMSRNLDPIIPRVNGSEVGL